MVRASQLRSTRGRAGKVPDSPEPTPIPGTPTFIRKVDGAQHQVWANSHTVTISISVPYAGGAIIVPFWLNSSSWIAIGGLTRNVTTSAPGNTVNMGTWVDGWAGSGSESHGGIQTAWILNATEGVHNITITGSNFQNFEILGAGALFYANCLSITASGKADGGPASPRSLSVASDAGRTTLGVFTTDNAFPPTRNGTTRWRATSQDLAGWSDNNFIQELPGAASVTHGFSGGGNGWGFGLDLKAAA